MLFLGGLMLASGFGFLREWSALQPALAALTLVWMVAGSSLQTVLYGSSITGWMFGVGKFKKFDGRAVLDDNGDADAVGWAGRGNQDFAASKLGGKVSHFKQTGAATSTEISVRPRR